MEDASEISLGIQSRIGPAFLECTDDAVFYVCETTIVYQNKRATELFGLPDPNTADATVGFLEEILGISIPQGSGSCVSIDTTCRGIDGARFPAIVRTTTVSDGERIVIVRDQSDRVATEESLRRRSAQLTATMESLPFDFWINDRDNRTLFQNRYSLALWGDQRGHTPDEVTDDPEILKEWHRTNALVFAGGVHRGEITYTIDGKDHTFRNILAPVQDDGETIGIVGLNIDITDYLDVANDREILLRELHHRVKNNLQIILSTIAYGRDTDTFDPDRLLRRIENHVHAIYLVHEQLYIGNELSTIDVGEYLRNLGASLDEALSFRSRIQVRSEPVTIPIEKAVPLGIAVAELLANAAQHGNTTGPGGTLPIAVSVQSRTVATGNGLYLFVENPVGGGYTPASFSTHGGLAIVSHLLDQLNVWVSTSCSHNTFTASLVFPL